MSPARRAIILNKAGFDASPVYTGTAAVESARTLQPDLIISDVIMPDMNGIEAAIIGSEMLPSLPCEIQVPREQLETAEAIIAEALKGAADAAAAEPPAETPPPA